MSNQPEPGTGVKNYDFILLQLSAPITQFTLTLNPFGQNPDMDATYFSGTCTGTCNTTNFLSNLVGKYDTLSSLQTITGVTGVKTGDYTLCATACTTDQVFTVTPGGSVNWILIGANVTNADQIADYFKLESLGYVLAPEPATFGLAGAALAAIGLLRRRKILSFNS